MQRARHSGAGGLGARSDVRNRSPQLQALRERPARPEQPGGRRSQFIIVSIITCADAVEHLATGKHPENSVLIMVFSLITMLLLGGIGCVKLWLNSHIHSKALEQVPPPSPLHILIHSTSHTQHGDNRLHLFPRLSACSAAHV